MKFFSLTAAVLSLAFITAWESLFDRAKLRPNQTVLIHGGSGGVGHLAVQLAINIGAKVATTASGNNLDYLQKLGVEKIIDYKNENVSEACFKWTQGQGVDVIFDSVGGEVFNQSLTMTSLYGQIVTLLHSQFDENQLAQARQRNISIHY